MSIPRSIQLTASLRIVPSCLRETVASRCDTLDVSGYDVIGDIHGESGKLVGLLTRLGYESSSGVYRHPDQQAIFVGDLIDRGNGHLDVLTTVRTMVDAGAAQIVMGNHEFNAIAYATEHPDRPGEYLRKRNEKNNEQHRGFLEQIAEDERAGWIEWFKTLPLWLDLDGGIRVVHACWHGPSIDLVERALADAGTDLDTFFVKAATKDNDLYKAIEILLKGPEMSLERYGLPPFLDKCGHPRSEARIRWWNAEGATVKDLAEIQQGAKQEDGSPYPEVDAVACDETELAYEYRESTPVFFGHYWRDWLPTVNLDWTDTTACVDFSAGAGGPLVAYR